MQTKQIYPINSFIPKKHLLILCSLCFYSSISCATDLDDILNNAGYKSDREDASGMPNTDNAYYDRIDDNASTPLNSADQQGALTQMVNESESKGMTFSLNSENDTPEFLEIKMPVPVMAKSANGKLDFAGVAKHFLSSNKKAFKLDDPDDELKVITVSRDDNDNRHVKFQQTYHGIPIWGKEALVHMDEHASVYYFNGRYRPSIVTQKGLDQQPSISEYQAENQIKNDLGVSELQILNKELMIYSQNTPRLVYQFDVMVGIDQRWLYFIDAHTAQVMHRIDQIHTNFETVQAEGVDIRGKARSFTAVKDDNIFYMFDPTLPNSGGTGGKAFFGSWEDEQREVASIDFTGTMTKAVKESFTVVLDAKERNSLRKLDLVRSNHSSKNWDKVAVSAMYNALRTQKYFLDTFKRNGIDGKGMPAKSVIHYSKNYNNAFWNGVFMTYGDGDGEIFSSMAGCLDLGAHEMTHGVIGSTAKLIYEKQSGALNESFADVFAIMVDRDDWLLFEDCTIVKPGFARNIENPNKGLPPQPKKMSNYKNLPLSRDHGGVHVNSGIPNYAAYLTIKAIGHDKAEQIYYQALSYYLLKNSQFIDARRALIQSASDIYGKGSKEVKAVATAWNKVEVFEPENNKPREQDQKPGGNDIKEFESELRDILKL